MLLGVSTSPVCFALVASHLQAQGRSMSTGYFPPFFPSTPLLPSYTYSQLEIITDLRYHNTRRTSNFDLQFPIKAGEAAIRCCLG
jgi:hypothetical protein